MTATTPTPAPASSPAPEVVDSVRAIAWRRRRVATGRFIRQFAQHRTGVAGVAILVFFVLVAVTAPWIFPEYLLDPIDNLSNPALAPPSSEFYYWLGTDNLGRSVLAELAWGTRPSLVVGIIGSIIAMVIGTLVGISSGHFRNLLGSGMRAAHRLVPGAAVHPAGDRASGSHWAARQSGSRWSCSDSRHGQAPPDWCAPRL